ncbi:hypothetical protein M885DRAFT_150043 [Pelagophyceae sp. CCMP2097]|nr:hypothetical protein M885DRAFT_150043 [Pelagophyceae sp. CCMP2097]
MMQGGLLRTHAEVMLKANAVAVFQDLSSFVSNRQAIVNLTKSLDRYGSGPLESRNKFRASALYNSVLTKKLGWASEAGRVTLERYLLYDETEDDCGAYRRETRLDVGTLMASVRAGPDAPTCPTAPRPPLQDEVEQYTIFFATMSLPHWEKAPQGAKPKAGTRAEVAAVVQPLMRAIGGGLVGSQLELFDGAGVEDSFFPPAARASLQHAAAELGVDSREVLRWLAHSESLACDVVWTCPPVARKRLDAVIHLEKFAKTKPKFGGDLRLRVLPGALKALGAHAALRAGDNLVKWATPTEHEPYTLDLRDWVLSNAALALAEEQEWFAPVEAQGALALMAIKPYFQQAQQAQRAHQTVIDGIQAQKEKYASPGGASKPLRSAPDFSEMLLGRTIRKSATDDGTFAQLSIEEDVLSLHQPNLHGKNGPAPAPRLGLAAAAGLGAADGPRPGFMSGVGGPRPGFMSAAPVAGFTTAPAAVPRPGFMQGGHMDAGLGQPDQSFDVATVASAGPALVHTRRRSDPTPAAHAPAAPAKIYEQSVDGLPSPSARPRLDDDDDLVDESVVRSVFIQNLPHDMGADELRDLFKPCGEVRAVQIYDRYDSEKKKKKKEPRGKKGKRAYRARIEAPTETPTCALVEFVTAESARYATAPELNIFGLVVRKRPCRTKPATDLKQLYLHHLAPSLGEEELVELLRAAFDGVSAASSSAYSVRLWRRDFSALPSRACLRFRSHVSAAWAWEVLRASTRIRDTDQQPPFSISWTEEVPFPMGNTESKTFDDEDDAEASAAAAADDDDDEGDDDDEAAADDDDDDERDEPEIAADDAADDFADDARYDTDDARYAADSESAFLDARYDAR